MSKSTKQIVEGYIHKWEKKTQAEPESYLPEISSKSSEIPKRSQLLSPKPRRKINFIKRNMGHMTSRRPYNMRKSSQADVVKVVPIFPVTMSTEMKSHSSKLIDYPRPLTEEELKWEFTHAFMIAKSKLIVDNARAARFSGLSSPRVLRNKANKFIFSKENQLNDDLSENNIPRVTITRDQKSEVIVEGKLRRNGFSIPTIDKRFISPQPFLEEKDHKNPCNVLPSRF